MTIITLLVVAAAIGVVAAYLFGRRMQRKADALSRTIYEEADVMPPTEEPPTTTITVETTTGIQGPVHVQHLEPTPYVREPSHIFVDGKWLYKHTWIDKKHVARDYSGCLPLWKDGRKPWYPNGSRVRKGITPGGRPYRVIYIGNKRIINVWTGTAENFEQTTTVRDSILGRTRTRGKKWYINHNWGGGMFNNWNSHPARMKALTEGRTVREDHYIEYPRGPRKGRKVPVKDEKTGLIVCRERKRDGRQTFEWTTRPWRWSDLGTDASWVLFKTGLEKDGKWRYNSKTGDSHYVKGTL